MRSYEIRHRVLFEDTNLVGNVYFARYLAWQGHCRELFLLERAPDVIRQLGNGLTLITTRCSCDFLAEAVVGDEIAIRMRLTRLARHLVTLEFEYWRLEEAEELLIARGEQQVACMRRASEGMIPEPIPAQLLRALESYREEPVLA